MNHRIALKKVTTVWNIDFESLANKAIDLLANKALANKETEQLAIDLISQRFDDKILPFETICE